ncbi:MAG: hypothetical protein LBD20_09010 [Spirochaetaceae bacterium]|jgi:hypothetical protein|nr:hypothetical protein [Spirochaetaceae bacterium]
MKKIVCIAVIMLCGVKVGAIEAVTDVGVGYVCAWQSVCTGGSTDGMVVGAAGIAAYVGWFFNDNVGISLNLFANPFIPAQVYYAPEDCFTQRADYLETPIIDFASGLALRFALTDSILLLFGLNLNCLRFDYDVKDESKIYTNLGLGLDSRLHCMFTDGFGLVVAITAHYSLMTYISMQGWAMADEFNTIAVRPAIMLTFYR